MASPRARLSRGLAVLPAALAYLGPRWAAYRGLYTVRSRLGLLRRRLPARPWQAQPLSAWLSDASLANPTAYLDYRRGVAAPPFFFSPADQPAFRPFFAAWDAEAELTPVQLAAELAAGKLRYFSGEPVEISFPPDWHRDPFSGQRFPAGVHWTRIGDAGPTDIKLIWEPNRFAFVFALVRAYWRSGDEHLAELFWQAVESWRDANPPQLGANWHSGQEVALRLMAWCFGFYGFLDAPATSPERAAALAQMVAVSGQRIAAHIDYALSQQNNHGVSEAAGLWTAGLLFPELRQAAAWRQQGRRVLEELGQTLLYDDGAFSQHSFNYQRLAMHAWLWAARLGDVAGQSLSNDLVQRLQTAAELLYQLQDAASGRLPNYGQNDGALFLPLDNCDYSDFRPLLQLAAYLLSGQRRYAAGPWDEALLWFGGPQALAAPLKTGERGDHRADLGGYYSLRSATGFAFVRCASFRHRPGQADMLHLDLWRQGQNIALDPGTYSYNAPPPWDNALARTSRHNTVAVDDLDQMRLASRFLWLPWLRAQSRGVWHSADGRLAYWEGAHNGYERLPSPVWHRRGLLRLGDDAWLVWDRMFSRGPHSYRLHWLLPELPYDWEAESGRLCLQTEAGPYHLLVMASAGDSRATLVRADPDSARGWLAPRYHALAPALSLALTAQGQSIDFLSLFSPEPAQLTRTQQRISLESPLLQADLLASSGPRLPLLASAAMTRPQLASLALGT